MLKYIWMKAFFSAEWNSSWPCYKTSSLC